MTTEEARTCKTCGMEFMTRYFLAAHYVDAHGLVNSAIADVMGQGLRTVDWLLGEARREQERRKAVSE